MSIKNSFSKRKRSFCLMGNDRSKMGERLNALYFSAKNDVRNLSSLSVLVKEGGAKNL